MQKLQGSPGCSLPPAADSLARLLQPQVLLWEAGPLQQMHSAYPRSPALHPLPAILTSPGMIKGCTHAGC